MTPERRAKLEAAGHTIATAEDFFGLDDADRIVMSLRLQIARAVRQLRDSQGLTQRDLAERMKVSQPRVANIEQGKNATLDAILTAYLALGGQLPDFGIVEGETPESRLEPPVAPKSIKKHLPPVSTSQPKIGRFTRHLFKKKPTAASGVRTRKGIKTS